MIEEMTAAGHPPPHFRAEPYLFSVTFYNKQERPPVALWQRTMNERQVKALEYMQRYGRITSREYQQLCPDVSVETLRLDLANLVEKGVLLKIGDKKGRTTFSSEGVGFQVTGCFRFQVVTGRRKGETRGRGVLSQTYPNFNLGYNHATRNTQHATRFTHHFKEDPRWTCISVMSTA
jgi:hypothetical protein